MSEESFSLTDHEGALLSFVLREQPITAYQIRRSYETSPVTNRSSSTGQIYPMIKRLKALGLLTSERVAGDRRGTEQLFCTEQGEGQIRRWISDIRPAHLLLEDPLRTKVQSFPMLSREEQIAWIVDVKSALAEKLTELEAYEKVSSVPMKEHVHDNAVASLRARMDWLDRLMREVVRS